MWLREKNNNNGKNAEQEQLTLAGGPVMMKEHHQHVLVLDWPADVQMVLCFHYAVCFCALTSPVDICHISTEFALYVALLQEPENGETM